MVRQVAYVDGSLKDRILEISKSILSFDENLARPHSLEVSTRLSLLFLHSPALLDVDLEAGPMLAFSPRNKDDAWTITFDVNTLQIVRPLIHELSELITAAGATVVWMVKGILQEKSTHSCKTKILNEITKYCTPNLLYAIAGAPEAASLTDALAKLLDDPSEFALVFSSEFFSLEREFRVLEDEIQVVQEEVARLTALLPSLQLDNAPETSRTLVQIIVLHETDQGAHLTVSFSTLNPTGRDRVGVELSM